MAGQQLLWLLLGQRHGKWRKRAFSCVPHTHKEKSRSYERWSSQCPLFLLRFMNISGDERNKAWGSSRWKNSIISQEEQTLTLPSHTLTHAQVHKPHTGADTHRIFQFAIRPSVVNSPCSPPLSFVFGIKVPPRHKSQILYDIVEIALSKMQSAKAASSADELPWLRKRQWLVSFARIGSVEGRAQRGPEEATAGPPHPPEQKGTTFLNVKSAVCYNSSENTLSAKLMMSIQK